MVHEYVYTLGLAGNRTKVEEFRYDEGSSRPALAERTVRYIYDDLYRLVHEIVTVKNSAGTGTQWQRTDTFTYDKVGNRKTMQRKTINQQTDVLYDYNAADQLLCETATTLQREAGGGYAAAPRPTRFAGVALGSIAALAFACLLAPFALLRTSGQGRKAQRNRRFVACVSAFFVPLMAIDPSHVYALHKEAMAYQALAAAGLATVDPNTQVTTYDYDANGNMVEKVVDNPSAGIKTTLYTYDAENRLATVDDGSGVGGVVSYTYDADGIRTSKLVGVTLTTYVVDKNRPYAQVLEERLEVGGVSTVVKRYVYGHDLISQTDSPGDGQYASTSYFHYDGQMSTRALSQGATVISDPTPAPLGSVIAKYSYDAFGSSLDLQGNLLPAGSTSATDYLYTGEQHDANAGFYYLRARYYSPGVGRFITRDTYQGSVHDPVSMHRYLYCHANPVNGIDPSGHWFGTLTGQLFTMGIISIVAKTLVVSVGLGAVAGGALGAYFHLTQTQSFEDIQDSIANGALYGAILGAVLGLSWVMGPTVFAIALETTFALQFFLTLRILTDSHTTAETKAATILLLIMGAIVVRNAVPPRTRPVAPPPEEPIVPPEALTQIGGAVEGAQSIFNGVVMKDGTVKLFPTGPRAAYPGHQDLLSHGVVAGEDVAGGFSCVAQNGKLMYFMSKSSLNPENAGFLLNARAARSICSQFPKEEGFYMLDYGG